MQTDVTTVVNARRDCPVVATDGFNKHVIRTNRLRYIPYRDECQERHGHGKKPDERTNLVGITRVHGIDDESGSGIT